MQSANHWGGSLDITDGEELNTNANASEWDKGSIQGHRLMNNQKERDDLDETQQSWLLGPQDKYKKKKYVNLGCVMISQKALKWTLLSIFVAFIVIGLPIIIARSLPKHKDSPPPPDNYTLALRKALMFFNAQKSGKLPKNNGVSWRANSGLNDGFPDAKTGLVGGYYDAGDNVKFHFPMAFSMTMLSWSLIEYRHKFETIDEFDHMRDLIKWGTDYFLLTFNTSAPKIDKLYIQVGGALNGSTTPDDHYCWEKPEDMDYKRPILSTDSAPDLASEMAAALSAASIVFRDNPTYSKKLVKAAEKLWVFARDKSRRRSYCRGNPMIEPFYNSTSLYDEYMWGAAWLHYATGNMTYLNLATDYRTPQNAFAFQGIPDLYVLSWNNKLPAAMLLLTRYRIFLNPGYPYEGMLKMYHNTTGITMCSYLPQYQVFNWTRGGLIQLNHGAPQPLQHAAYAAFLASLFVDYLNDTGVPGWNCGPTFISNNVLKTFAVSQIDYILGNNPMNMSYVVGYGRKFPRHVHHRGASIPNDHKKYSCTGGLKWLDEHNPNPHNITGAMVGGPDRFDHFHDVRKNYNYTEPTLVGNAGLVAALVSLTSSGGYGIDRNAIFSAVPPLYPESPPPPQPWKP